MGSEHAYYINLQYIDSDPSVAPGDVNTNTFCIRGPGLANWRFFNSFNVDFDN